ncbi:hypothetical protein MRB53_014315 [Persea americana]|uniref:Uncharacterized protein n=1 Tax=Persea americana TaxID=3435 RepID=A0ACC2KAF6_PERAE|nr:hypothetical protein MRB53_014315 [Persea americana]
MFHVTALGVILSFTPLVKSNMGTFKHAHSAMPTDEKRPAIQSHSKKRNSRKLPWRAGEVLRDALVMQRGGREALTCEWDDFCVWREKRKRRLGLCAAGAVCVWRKKGRRFAGVREMKSRETGEGGYS